MMIVEIGHSVIFDILFHSAQKFGKLKIALLAGNAALIVKVYLNGFVL